ncbi:hypothetical protein [Candidatus Uabimicrobium amorphum]|uniref:PD(D/E)XK endonuclease domain-containing protein n=1 Tax=Uabimicrobium amorphum TaxID=2596890 RepID=A0A5S9IV25_UABAM|nr:hypothetical protein [Candidatus Uabimicrobium amorphum]BBM87115.1 hypothetical protein UABAM_05518 [Candidatus Uabimicrobium amorphum]
MEEKNLQVTSNVGLYYVCYKLSLQGWNAMPTARNAKGVDIIAYNSDCSKMISIQVKTLSKRNAVPLGRDLGKVMGNYWIIVNEIDKEPKTFVLIPEEVKKLAEKREKEGQVSYWLQVKSYSNEEYFEKWDRIGEI